VAPQEQAQPQLGVLPPQQQQQQQPHDQEHEQDTQQQQQQDEQGSPAAAVDDADEGPADAAVLGEGGWGALELLRSYSLASDADDSLADSSEQQEASAADAATTEPLVYGPQLPADLQQRQQQDADTGAAAAAVAAAGPVMHGPQLPPAAAADAAGGADAHLPADDVVGAVEQTGVSRAERGDGSVAAADGSAAGGDGGAAGDVDVAVPPAAMCAIIDKLLAFMSQHGTSFEVGRALLQAGVGQPGLG